MHVCSRGHLKHLRTVLIHFWRIVRMSSTTPLGPVCRCNAIPDVMQISTVKVASGSVVPLDIYGRIFSSTTMRSRTYVLHRLHDVRDFVHLLDISLRRFVQPC